MTSDDDDTPNTTPATHGVSEQHEHSAMVIATCAAIAAVFLLLLAALS